MQSIPSLIEKSIYLGTEMNEDNRNPSMLQFYYYGAGLNIGNESYTCKSVFVLTKDNELYYDQNLSTIEKGRFVDIMLQKKSETFNPQKTKDSLGLESSSNLSQQTPWETEPSGYYDKRLIYICQCPQLPYLDENMEPTRQVIEDVRNGKLKIINEGQKYKMMDIEEDEKSATDFVLCKLKAAGIEVVQDKEQFENILKGDSILQK